MLRKISLLGITMAIVDVSFSQDSTRTSPLTISGSADLYYKYDFGKAKANNLTSFTNSQNSFELGMMSAKFHYKTSKVEAVADFGFGKRAKEFSYNDEGITAAVKQLYLSYYFNKQFKLTAGSWATHIGYESVDAPANRNYSMSYMFTNGPFFHTGIKAELSVQSHGFMIGVANPTDFKYVPDGSLNKKFLIGQYSFSPSDGFKVYLNYVGGKNMDTSKTKQYDLVICNKFSEKFGVVYCATLNQIKKYSGNKVYDANKSWWATAVYLNYDPTTHFGLTLREEYFSDKDGLKIPKLELNGNIFSTTLSANIKVDKLIVIPEFRVDKSNKFLFVKTDGNSTPIATNVLLAVVYSF